MKPHNVLLQQALGLAEDWDAADLFKVAPKIADFGLSKLIPHELLLECSRLK